MRRLLFFLLLALPVIGSSQQRTFQNPLLLPTVGDVAALATGDWNNDGKKDIAYIDSSANPSLHILLGKGDGSFTQGQTTPLAAGSCSYAGATHSCYLLQADVNGDRQQDFIFATSLSTGITLTTLIGNGDGTFGTPIISSVPGTLDYPYSFIETPAAIGDYTGDGKVDIVVSDYYYGAITLLAGDGAGHFTFRSSFQSTTVSSPLGSYAYDFNHDGKLDILVSGSPGSGSPAAQVFYGNGSGSFTPGPSVNMPVTLFADVTGDGIPDIVYYGSTGIVAVPILADGSFGASQNLTNTPGTSATLLLSAADLDGDGIPDLILNPQAGMEFIHGQGKAQFAAPQTFTAGASSLNRVVSADFNQDGIPDLALGGAGGITLFFGNALDNFTSGTLVNVSNSAASIAAGDFNGDGRADLILFQSTGAFQTYFGTTSGSLNLGPASLLSPPRFGTYSTVVADFDGDGKLDVASGYGPLQVAYGNGDGSFNLVTTTDYVSNLFAADVNKDGKTDVVSLTGISPAYAISSFLSSSQRTFTEVDTPITAVDFNPSLVAVGDLNRDGYPDAIIYSSTFPGMQIWLGKGDGTFSMGNILAIPSSVPSPAGASYQVADIDNDGNLDIVILGLQSTGLTSNLTIYYGDGTGNFQSPQSVTLTHPYQRLQIKDINNDGLPEFIVSDANLIAVVPNLGHRSFGSEAFYVAGGQIAIQGVADFDGDGFPDLYASDGAIVEVLLNQPAKAMRSGNIPLATITATPQPLTYNQAFSLAAVISPGSSGLPSPTGSVQFAIDGTVVGTAALQSGTATFTVSGTVTQSFATGQHSITAVYSGDSTYATAVATGTLAILEPVYATTTSLISTATTIQAGQFVTLNVTIASLAKVTNGIVTFYSGPSILGQASVSSTGTASLQTNLFSLGSNSLTATYHGYTVPTGAYGLAPAVFQPSTSTPILLTVNADSTTTILTTSSTSLTAGTVLTLTAKVSSVATPYGGLTFYDGSTPLGTIALDSSGSASYSTVALSSGQHLLSAVYAANDPFSGSSSSSSSIAVNPAAITLNHANVFFIANNANGTAAGMQVIAAVTSSNSAIPTGTITLLEDNQVVGTAVLSPTGQALLPISSANAALHTLYASYSGDSTFGPAASPFVKLTDYTASPDFSMQLVSGTSSSVTHPVAIALDSLQNWSGSAKLSCTAGLPVGYACVFTPSTISGTGQTTLSIVPVAQPSLKFAGLAAIAFSIPCCFYRRRVRLILAGTLALTILVGCAVSTVSTAPQPSIITVQAVSGTITHSLQFTFKPR